MERDFERCVMEGGTPDECLSYQSCAAAVVDCEGTYAHRWPADANDRIWRFFVSATP